jgi:hypothetical protein
MPQEPSQPFPATIPVLSPGGLCLKLSSLITSPLLELGGTIS